MEFFRHCPGCGRRFHIKLVDKKLVTEHRESIPRMVPSAYVAGVRGYSFGPVSVQEGRPMIIDVEEFQYAYKCVHCGHEWSEKHVKEQRES